MLRSEVEDLKRKLDAKDDEINAARRGEAEGQDRMSSIQAAVRAAEAAAQKLAEESEVRKARGRAFGEAGGRFWEARRNEASHIASEKLKQREDVIVELRARMDEYERGVHGLREEAREGTLQGAARAAVGRGTQDDLRAQPARGGALRVGE